MKKIINPWEGLDGYMCFGVFELAKPFQFAFQIEVVGCLIYSFTFFIYAGGV